MSTNEDFKKAFDATLGAIAEGKTGADVVLDLAPPPDPAPAATPPAATPPAAVADPAAAPPAAAPAAATPPADPPAATPPADPAAMPPVAATPPAVAATPPADPAATPPAAAATPPAAAATPPADPAATPPAAAAPPAATPPAGPTDAQLLAEAKAENARLARELAEKTAAPAATPPAAAAPPAATPPAADPTPPAPKPYEFDAPTKAKVDDFEKEWPDHAEYQKAQALALQHAIAENMKALFGDFVNKVNLGLAPVVNAHIQSGEEKHLAAIQAAHPDFAEVLEPIKTWIDQQPAYLQAPLKEVYEKGNTPDVIDLFTRFKKETGRAPPQSQSPAASVTPAPAAAAPAAPPPDAGKVAALTVVPAGRSKVNPDQPPAEDDYATAFAKSVAAMTAVAK